MLIRIFLYILFFFFFFFQNLYFDNVLRLVKFLLFVPLLMRKVYLNVNVGCMKRIDRRSVEVRSVKGKGCMLGFCVLKCVL